MAYLDISCANCGGFYHDGPRKISRCPQCGTEDIIVIPHDWQIDARFRGERDNMLDRMDVD